MIHRRGMTLIELLAVMAVGAVMMAVAVALLYGLLRMDGAGRESIRRRSVLDRLAEQFRRDVHAAETITPLAGAEGWQFELAAGRTVTYRVEPGGLSRSEPPQGESFALPPGSTASIQLQADAGPAIVSLSITPGLDPAGQPAGRTVRIEAVLGHDLRFAGPQGPREDAP